MNTDRPFRYDAKMANEIEERWQRRWARENTFWSPNPAGTLSAGFAQMAGRPKSYVLDMFAYPSGSGLHVGHPLGYIASDVVARYQRMTGHHVLHAYGYDAFGLPAEQFAIETGQHPRVTTEANIAVMRGQLDRLGLGHDPRRELSTADPRYYRWTQWIFNQIFGSWYDERARRARPVADLVAEYESGLRLLPDGRAWEALSPLEQRQAVNARRLAYLSDEPVNWCPGLGTVLANEEVTAQGRSDVGNFPVYRRPMRQWMLRITAYADRLAADLDLVAWPESVKTMQRNWIGAADHPDGTRTYRMRDWLFSRQRYWGEPFPIVYDADGLPVAVPDAMLPVLLPDMTDFRPVVAANDDAEPVPPLGRVPGWATVELDLGDGQRVYRREVNVMPQWAGSCWYYLRYLDPDDDEAFVSRANERYWMSAAPARAAGTTQGTSAAGGPGGVDLYVGGVEHAVLHLLYARFWHKVLFDLGHVSTPEPFARLVNQGYVLADAYTDERGQYVPAAEVRTAAGGEATYRGRPVTRRSGKMGKSLKNGIAPDQIYRDYGADTLRLQEMAAGPLASDRPWRPDDIIGMHRLLQRLWRSIVSEQTGEPAIREEAPEADALRLLHRTIAVVRDDFDGLRFHTAIARLGELITAAARISVRDGGLPRAIAEPMVLMLAPLTPHVAEELWSRLGNEGSLAYEPFPRADPALSSEREIRLPVQVDGRTRLVLEVPVGADRAEIERLLDQAGLSGLTGSGTVRRMVIVPGRIVNIITR